MEELKLELNIRTKRTIDLYKLIKNDNINEDDLVAAINTKNIDKLSEIIGNLPKSNHWFAHEIDEECKIEGEETEKFIELKLGDQSVIHNLS